MPRRRIPYSQIAVSSYAWNNSSTSLHKSVDVFLELLWFRDTQVRGGSGSFTSLEQCYVFFTQWSINLPTVASSQQLCKASASEIEPFWGQWNQILET